MKTRTPIVVALAAVVLALLVGCRGGVGLRPDAAALAVARSPHLDPDYSGVIIPRNLAPLNFTVRERGSAYYAEVTVAGRTACAVSSAQPTLRFPAQAWRRALDGAAAGSAVGWLVWVRDATGRWQRFAPVKASLGPPIDRYLVYRKIGPVYNFYSDVRIQQRDLQTQAEQTVLGGGQLGGGCVNCHTFHANRTERMTVNVRGDDYGDHALLAVGGQITKLEKPWGYNSWHPNGEAVAYSLNRVRQFFHDAGPEVRDVIDLDSDVVVYRLDTKTVVTAPALSERDRVETYPYWSADGKYLYYCSGPILWADRERVPRRQKMPLRYDLRRVAYDAQTGKFGPAETVISADQVKKSVLLPRPSPDGRWLLFCMCDAGCFPIYSPSSDLYLMDLRDGSYRRLQINSDQSESWHSWSSDSQWIAFSSKRRDGLFTRTYLAHVDTNGRVSRPLMVPQADPAGYDQQLKTATVPELVTEPVRVGRLALGAAARGKRQTSLKMPDISMTRKPKTPSRTEAWQQPQR